MSIIVITIIIVLLLKKDDKNTLRIVFSSGPLQHSELDCCYHGVLSLTVVSAVNCKNFIYDILKFFQEISLTMLFTFGWVHLQTSQILQHFSEAVNVKFIHKHAAYFLAMKLLVKLNKKLHENTKRSLFSRKETSGKRKEIGVAKNWKLFRISVRQMKLEKFPLLLRSSCFSFIKFCCWKNWLFYMDV